MDYKITFICKSCGWIFYSDKKIAPISQSVLSNYKYFTLIIKVFSVLFFVGKCDLVPFKDQVGFVVLAFSGNQFHLLQDFAFEQGLNLW